MGEHTSGALVVVLLLSGLSLLCVGLWFIRSGIKLNQELAVKRSKAVSLLVAAGLLCIPPAVLAIVGAFALHYVS